ncbi:MAG TPA: 6-phosphogluconolactonase [Actinobacteria bacterium]|nr:6-phosphogluconolactonase [Actinomycetota bacterium]
MTVRVFSDGDALAAAAAEMIAALVGGAGPVDVGLAGGNTPAATYRHLAQMRLDWPRVDAWMTDERYVPPDHPDCNAGMVRATLADRVPMRLHTIPWLESVHESARSYERALPEFLAMGPDGLEPHLVVLGLGEDGHTASLFRECPPPDPARDFVAIEVPERGWRLTATYALLGRAHHTMFLVAGERKAEALAAVLAAGSDLPAARVSREARDPVWLVDRAAARLL